MVQPAYKTNKCLLYIISHSAVQRHKYAARCIFQSTFFRPTQTDLHMLLSAGKKFCSKKRAWPKVPCFCEAQISTVGMNLRRNKMIYLSHSICYHLIKSNILILPSIHLSLYPSFPLSIYLFIYNIYLSIHRRIYPCIHLSIQPSNVCMYIYRRLYIYISFCWT